MTSAERIEKLVKGLKAVSELMGESARVSGLHRNGEIASWDELLGNEWLSDFNVAMGEVMNMTNEQLEKDQNQHEIKMTDDPIYRDWYRQEQRRKEIDEHGIDED